MQCYESYKPSGLNWLGDIPAHWNLKKSKFLWREKEDRSLLGDEELLSVSQYSGVVPRKGDSRSESLEDYKRCEPNDLVINIMLAWMSGLGVSKYSGIVSPAYCVYKQLEDHNPSYFDYLYRSPQYLGEFARRSKGIVPSRWRMYTEEFGQVLSLLPSREEQDRIVAVLDQKTAEIDAAIAKKERLIEILIEQKRTLINQAVTTGLDQSVSQHYSGVEWIGDIPLGWEVVPVTKYTKSIVDYRGKTPEKVAIGVFLVTAKNIKKGRIDYTASTEFVSEKDYPKIMARGLPEIGDLLFTTEAPLGEVALVDRTDVAFAQRIIKLRLKRDRLLPKFVVYAMSAGYFQALLAREATGSTALGIKASKLHKLKIIAPSLAEQNRIVEYLDEAGAKIEVLLSRIHSEIESLCDLKMNTVASYVTGRFKV